MIQTKPFRCTLALLLALTLVPLLSPPVAASNTTIRLAISCTYGNTEWLGEELFADWTYDGSRQTGNHDEGCFNADSVSAPINTQIQQSYLSLWEDDGTWNDPVDVADGSCGYYVGYDYANERFTVDGSSYEEGSVVTINGPGGSNCGTAGSLTFTFWFE